MAFALIPGLARGQALTFTELQRVLKPGDTVLVEDRAGEETLGKVAELTTSSLVLAVAEKRGDRVAWNPDKKRPFPVESVAEIRRADSSGRAGERVFIASLQQVLKTSQTIVVKDEAGRTKTGKVAEVSPSSLVILTRDGDRQWTVRQELSPSSVREIKAPHRLWDGPLIGLAAGIIPLLFFDDASPELLLLGAGIGAGIGFGIDVAIPARRLYAAPKRAGVSVGPLVSPDRKGIQVAVRF